MPKTNIVDLAIYREQHTPDPDPIISTAHEEELVIAIKYLIQRLRTSNPIQS